MKLNVLGGYEIGMADLWLGSHGETPEQYAQICQAGDWRWLRSHSGLLCCLTSLIVNRPRNSSTCQTPQPLKSSQVLLFMVIPLCQVHRKCSVDTRAQLIHLITMNIKRNQCLEHNGHKYLMVFSKKCKSEFSLAQTLSSFVQIQINQTFTEHPLVCSRQGHIYLHLRLYVYSQPFYPFILRQNIWVGKSLHQKK